MEGLVSIQATDKPAGNRRRSKREIRPEIDRRAEHPFNGDTATRLVTDPYSTTGGKIAVTASLRDDPLGKLYARRQIDDAQYRLAKDWAYLNRKAPALLPSIGFKIVVRSLLREARERRQVALWLER
jgi:hypothetical protein